MFRRGQRQKNSGPQLLVKRINRLVHFAARKCPAVMLIDAVTRGFRLCSLKIRDKPGDSRRPHRGQGQATI
jgi:hypothetical protein